jgi:hypothetical protein
MLKVLLIVAALLAAPAAAHGKPAITITCDAGQYQLLHGENPRIADLMAHNLPRRTSGYAPRCLVAEAIASDIQRALQDGRSAPRMLSVYGARWGAGRWRCSYPADRADCHRKGKPRRRVTMRLI